MSRHTQLLFFFWIIYYSRCIFLLLYKSDDRESLSQDQENNNTHFHPSEHFALLFYSFEKYKIHVFSENQNHLKRARATAARRNKYWNSKAMRRQVFSSCIYMFPRCSIDLCVSFYRERERRKHNTRIWAKNFGGPLAHSTRDSRRKEGIK